MIKRFRKKPVTVEAMRYGPSPAEAADVYRWVEENTLGSYDTNDIYAPVPESGVSIDADTGWLVIATLEGEMYVSPGDYVIRGVYGDFYPCKPEIFKETYEPEGTND